MKNFKNMIEFGGILYFLDVDALEQSIILKGNNPKELIVDTTTTTYYDANGKVTHSEKIESSTERGREIDATKYDILRVCVEVLIDYNEESDDTLGADRALEKTPLAYKLAFNTLLAYNILKEVEEK
jgi:hypothetical protein